MIRHVDISDAGLRKLIRQKKISFGGNARLKIYGTLGCSSGKRMKKESRVFFREEKEATDKGFRPCGHCLNDLYKKWKDEIV